jgi:hypothetical protein
MLRRSYDCSQAVVSHQLKRPVVTTLQVFRFLPDRTDRVDHTLNIFRIFMTCHSGAKSTIEQPSAFGIFFLLL